ncbi:MAG: hypothetical protein E7253_00750 [Lachnospiraceae bacterium]|nr:hypothetical protein [Lachnospiraceae bacterium]
MGVNGEAMISLEYSAQEYINLGLELNSSEEKWESALKMIEARFRERYFSTINYLSIDFSCRANSNRKIEKNGFAIMALNCLLIDTFYQFEYGLESSSEWNPITEDSGVGRHYTNFLRLKFPEIFMNQNAINENTDLASLFYYQIRCGILHSAQTKGCSMLTCESVETVEYIYREDKVGIQVNVRSLSKALQRYFFEDYLLRLKNGDVGTRSAFVEKMRYVCGY